MFIWGRVLEIEVGPGKKAGVCGAGCGSVSKLMHPFPLLLAGVLISLSLRLSLASFRGKYSVHKYENKPIIDPWTEFVSIRFCC